MNDYDIPIFKKAYDLYKTFYSYRDGITKQDRHTIWQRCENVILDILEGILLASQTYKSEKLPTLELVSLKLNFLRVFLRLIKEVKIIYNKKNTTLEGLVDEIGRMLGGWIKSTKT